MFLLKEDESGYFEEYEEKDEDKIPIPSIEWEHGKGLGSWQSRAEGVQSRTAYLFNNKEMSDLNILATDENWWYGDTVKDFTVRQNCIILMHSRTYENVDIKNQQT